jgi:hypothetical protein
VPLEREQHSAAPAHATGAVEFIALEDIAHDETFRLRPEGDVADLATSLGRLGQLVPVELRPWPGAGSDGPRWQVVAGFRRMAAVRVLARERVLARLHAQLSDGDAWGVALTQALLHEPLGEAELRAVRARLETSGVAPWAEELVEDALARAPVAPELRERFLEFLAATSTSTQEPAPLPDPLPAARGEGASPPTPTDDAIEVTPEELVTDLATRLSALNQDLAVAFEAWDDLPADGRRILVEQARYVAALLPFLEAE